MNLEARLLGDGDEAALAALFAASAGRLPQDPGLARAVAGPDASRLVGVLRSGELVAALAFVERRGRMGRSWIPPLFTPWSGLLARRGDEADSAAAAKLRREAQECAARFVRARAPRADVVLAPCGMDAGGFAEAGWRLGLRYTMVSRWTGDGAWRGAMESPARRQERKARDAGIAAAAKSASETAAMERLWRSTAARQGLDASLAGAIGRLGRWLEEQERGFLLEAAGPDGAPQACGLFGWDDERVYYLAGASDAEALGSGAPTLLHAALFEEVERRGLPRCYDWVGGNTESVARFKRRFGAQPEALACAAWRSRMVRVVEALRG